MKKLKNFGRSNIVSEGTGISNPAYDYYKGVVGLEGVERHES
jgi:hypothetical protein